MASRVENINKEILQKCRIQIGLELHNVEKKVKKIAEIEEGVLKPTFKQLDTLADLYKVPRWVFISDQLPEKYVFDKAVPAFRQFADSEAEVFSDPKVRSITTKVNRFRELILEILSDMDESIDSFNPPEIEQNAKPESSARLLRDWLEPPRDSLHFTEWKKLTEDKGVFVFMTSKYPGWSYVENRSLRGFAIYHSTLPIIVVNDSDAKKAQSFTLLHELAHLLRKESAIDDWAYQSKEIEKWCDELAGNLLMPESSFMAIANTIDDLDTVKRIAKNFNVSIYACLVRARQLNIIDQNMYEILEKELKTEFEGIQKQIKEKDGGFTRNRPKEVLEQYGHIYTNVLFQAYHNQDIGLHKLAKLFDLKKPSYVLEMERYL